MEWKKIEVGSIELEPQENYSREETETFYCAADSPVCSNRGKHRKEVRACWDTMKHLKYINGNLTDGNGSYFQILDCVECGDFYLEECTIDSFNEKEFTCFECSRKDEK